MFSAAASHSASCASEHSFFCSCSFPSADSAQILREQLALRRGGTIRLDAEELIEAKAGKQFVTARTTMHNTEMPLPSSFKRSATPAIVPMKS